MVSIEAPQYTSKLLMKHVTEFVRHQILCYEPNCNNWTWTIVGARALRLAVIVVMEGTLLITIS